MKRISSIVPAGLSLTAGHTTTAAEEGDDHTCSNRTSGGDGLFYCFAAD